MDLISREEVENKILNFCGFNCWEDKSSLMREISSAPSAFEGMTNGEVLIALFGGVIMDCSAEDVLTHITKSGDHVYKKAWWDSPYKGASE